MIRNWFSNRAYPQPKGSPLLSQAPTQTQEALTPVTQVSQETPPRRIRFHTQLEEEVPRSHHVAVSDASQATQVLSAEEDPLFYDEADPLLFDDDDAAVPEAIEEDSDDCVECEQPVAEASQEDNDDCVECEQPVAEASQETKEEASDEDDDVSDGTYCHVREAIRLDRAERLAEATKNGQGLLPPKEEARLEYAATKEYFETFDMPERTQQWTCKNPGHCSLFCLSEKTLMDVWLVREEVLVAAMREHQMFWAEEFCDHSTGDKTIIVQRKKEAFIRSKVKVRDTRCPVKGCVSRGCHPEGPFGDQSDNRNRYGMKLRMAFLRMYSAGLRHTDMRGFGIKLSLNALSDMHIYVDKILAAAHMLYNETCRDKYDFVEVDEFFIGGRKNNMGEQRVEQLCFQSLIGKKQRGTREQVIGFHVRYVPNREKDTLVPWIINMVKDGAHIDADGALSYSSIEKIAWENYEKRVHYSTVDHSKRFKAPDGTCTNCVEGMHMHVKKFLRQFGSMGKDKFRRILRVLAAAHLSVPKAAENPDGPKSISEKFGKCLRGIRLVACESVPVDAIIKQHIINFKDEKVPPIIRLIPNLEKQEGDVGKSPVRDRATGGLYKMEGERKTAREVFAAGDKQAKTKKAKTEVTTLSQDIKKEKKALTKVDTKKLANAEALEKIHKKRMTLAKEEAMLLSRQERLESQSKEGAAKLEEKKAKRKEALSETRSKSRQGKTKNSGGS